MVSGVSCHPARRASAGLALLTAALLGTAGCTGMEQASAAGASRDDLVSETVAQLSRGTRLTYTARYHLTDGGTATVTQAQHPARAAFDFPGGRLLELPGSTTRCEPAGRRLTCTRNDPAPATAAPLAGTTLVTPGAALAMLNTAALDSDVVSASHDTTIAGRHANCLSLAKVDGTPASEFALCVTNEGVLASFTATIDGRRIDQALTAYAETAEPAAFRMPATATVSDLRTRP
jgi:hypothetical protein